MTRAEPRGWGASDEVYWFHYDAERALRGLLSPPLAGALPDLSQLTPADLQQRLEERLHELNHCANLALLAAAEAAFRTHYLDAQNRQESSPVGQALRALYQTHGARAALEDGILACWQRDDRLKSSIGLFRGLLKYRHWLAHGRYWTPRLARPVSQYRFGYVHLAVVSVLRETVLAAD